jgi:GTP-binding protein HflX
MTNHEINSLNQGSGKAIVCMLKTNVHDHSIYRIQLEELKSLINTLGMKVVDEIIQSKFKPFAKYYFGSGKVKQLNKIIKNKKVDLVVFYNLLRSSQKLNLIRTLNCDVIDRYELTLEIFSKMANDNLSKLQIEAARLEKLVPFYRLQASLNYFNDRPFFRSGGEYAFHGQMRELTRRQARIKKEIESLINQKKLRIKNRKKLGYPVICIAGYYNAGKTSLFNALTGEQKPVSDQPFTTLTSKYQKRYVNNETTLLFIDTIGFVLDLDPRLIRSFQLNLLDIVSSDLVLLLIEITDPLFTIQLKLNESIALLRKIGLPRDKILIVFNKADKSPEHENVIEEKLELKRLALPWIVVSVKDRKKLNKLLQLIILRLNELNLQNIEEEKILKVEEISIT